MNDFDVDKALQVALDRLTLLNQTASVLSSTLDAVEGLRRVCRVLVPALADWCMADLVDEDGVVERVCISHRDGDAGLAGLTGLLPRSSSVGTGPLARVLHGAEPLLLSAEQLPPADSGGHAQRAVELDPFARLGAQSAIIAPLRARRRVVLGALTVVRTGDRPALDAEDVALVEDLTVRMALALDNARLHAQTRNIAERLQRSLLPAIPQVDGLGISARYSPASATAQVGGDWYDCFVLPGGDTALVIGDVAGHDLRAAVTMSQMRNMLRGIACDREEPPGMILRRLDAATTTLYPYQTATCVYAVLKGPEGGPYILDWSRAGHLPPLLVTPEGDTTYLTDAHGILLGTGSAAKRLSATTALPPGDTLLFYTDGLIERRGELLDHSLTRLRQHAAALIDQDLETMCDELVAGLTADADAGDDIALLALRLPAAAGA